MRDARIEYITYWCSNSGRYVDGTNVMYTMNGQPASARLSWRTSLDEAIRYIQRQRERSRFS